MKTLILAAIRCSLMFTAVAALSLAYPASVQAVPTTYQYTGNPFTYVHWPLHHEHVRDGNGDVGGPTGSEHAAHHDVTPTAFTFSDGVQTLSSTTPDLVFHRFQIRD